MSVRLIEGLQQYLRRCCHRASAPKDSDLLDRFVEADDREAFELLIARHGPMVLGTALRFVDSSHDAEDVFQTVFLSLARLAKSIRQGNTLPAWLHTATCRIAAKVRRNRVAESLEPEFEPSETVDPSARLVWLEIRQTLDEELEHLPDRLRSPLVLCYLSGLTRDEAAKQLGWSLGTLKRRLEQGRSALRDRLERRGIGAVALALAVLAPKTLQATVSKSLLDSSLSVVFSTGSVVPSTVAVLAGNSAAVSKGVVMKSIISLLVVAVGIAIYAGTGRVASPKNPRGSMGLPPITGGKGAFADEPLPSGSTLRFGSARYRHGTSIETMTVSPDGKTAFVASGSRFNGSTRAIDLTTGRTRFEIRGDGEAIAVAPNGRTFVIEQNLRLDVRNFETGKLLRSIELPQTNSRSTTDALAFTPDGKAIAATSRGDAVHLIDFETGKPIRDFVHANPKSSLTRSFSQVLALAFSPDGKHMATGGYSNENDNYFARLWDVATGKEVHRFMHGKAGYGIRCLAFSPDGRTLATLGTQSGVFLRLFDVKTGKLHRAFPKDGKQRSRGGSVVFTPDGKTVAVACSSIRLYDVATGKQRLRIDRRASHLHFTDAGRTLTAAISGAIYRWDTTTGKMLTPVAADSIVDQILVTPDGRRVVTRNQDGIGYLWDGSSGKQLRRFPLASYRGMASSPNGRFLAWPVNDGSVTFTEARNPRSKYDGSRIRLYDIAGDEFVDRFAAFEGAAQDLAFTNDGKQLVTVEQHGGRVRIWDFDSAKEVRSFPILTDDLKKEAFFVRQTRLSPDGTTAVVTYEQDRGGRLGGLRLAQQIVRLWNVATGKQRPMLRSGTPIAGAFSPDGRLVVTRSANSVYEIDTGRRVAALPAESSLRAAAFSRDGRLLATAVNRGVIQIWEVATWTKRNEFEGFQGRPTTLAFGPRGRLFSGNLDTTVLAWDTRPPLVADSVSLDKAWTDLAVRDSSVSFRSLGRFFTSPDDTIEFLANKVRPAKPLDPKRIRRLLNELDNDDFDVRESATTALRGFDRRVIPYLEATSKNSKSVEVRTRVKRLLEHQRNTPLDSTRLRRIRGVMILEQLASVESKKLLRKWSEGPRGALLTTEAIAATKRLTGQLETKP